MDHLKFSLLCPFLIWCSFEQLQKLFSNKSYTIHFAKFLPSVKIPQIFVQLIAKVISIHLTKDLSHFCGCALNHQVITFQKGKYHFLLLLSPFSAFYQSLLLTSHCKKFKDSL